MGLSWRVKFSLPSSIGTITPLVGQILIETNTQGIKNNFDELYLIYNHINEGAVYKPQTLHLLSLDETWQNDLTQFHWPTGNLSEVIGVEISILKELIREYLFVTVFRACVEFLASENASRLSAMQRAEKNIEELLKNLKNTFHRLRQGSIDEELFDVISGFEALLEDSLTRTYV